MLAVLAIAAGLFVWRTASDFVTDLGSSSCRAVASSYEAQLDPDAMDNAATITAIAVKRGLPARAATIALATAMQESKLHNIDYGDRDSLGLFQQRPSQGWGTEAQVLDPIHATNAFYDALVKIDGWQTMEITHVAQLVQKSAAPLAYAQHEPEGRALASTLAGHTPGGMGCRLPKLTMSEKRTFKGTVAQALTTQLGIRADRQLVGGSTLTVTATGADQANAIGAWAVAKAELYGIEQVTVGSRQWSRAPGREAWSWRPAEQATSPTTVIVR